MQSLKSIWKVHIRALGTPILILFFLGCNPQCQHFVTPFQTLKLKLALKQPLLFLPKKICGLPACRRVVPPLTSGGGDNNNGDNSFGGGVSGDGGMIMLFSLLQMLMVVYGVGLKGKLSYLSSTQLKGQLRLYLPNSELVIFQDISGFVSSNLHYAYLDCTRNILVNFSPIQSF